MIAKNFSIAGRSIAPGERVRVDLEVARLYDFTEMKVPVEVIRGKEDGPVLFVSGAIHGDEINGVEIIKQLLTWRGLRKLNGTLIAVPIVNVFGFNSKIRYLPDRRDLNRCFPGYQDGSLASQLAHIFMKEVVSKCTHGIDLHTGAIHRTNLPHIRACLDNPETMRLAEAFHVPVAINSDLHDGSLREAAQQLGIPMLLFEGGEALRFDEKAIRVGLNGVVSVMRAIGMLPQSKSKKAYDKMRVASNSYWVRAPHSGTCLIRKKPGDMVAEGEVLGTVCDPFGEHCFAVKARNAGIMIGKSLLPLYNEGDAMVHIATFDNDKHLKESVEEYKQALTGQSETYVM